MPATPAWPPQSTVRLFVEGPLVDGLDVRVEGGQAHYLANVMRLKQGDPVKLFDDKTGEWLALVTSVAKRDVILAVSAQLRPREDVPDLWLLAAPIKKNRIDLVAEKACELGVARFRPVITARTLIDRVNVDRLRAQMIEAAEQCGRTALPAVDAPVKLRALLTGWPEDRALYFADESGGMPILDALHGRSGPAAILIGPEGGFDQQEREAIRAISAAVPVSLGPRILRAETAAIAALSVWMAATGDWRV